MTNRYYDIIIIGSGMSGLYSAYNIQNVSPTTSFLILEKYKKQWIGGRTSNDMFYGTEIVTGAGIGRKRKDKLLHKLLTDLHFHVSEYTEHPHYSKMLDHVDIKKTVSHLKKEYKKFKDHSLTFKQFAINVLGEKEYKKFIIY